MTGSKYGPAPQSQVYPADTAAQMLEEIETRLPEQDLDDRKAPAGKQQGKAADDESDMRQFPDVGPLQDNERHDAATDQKRKNFSLFHSRFRSKVDFTSIC